MEADFQREYGLDLSAELGKLSWRRFIVLVRGLGPHSATAVKLMARRYGGRTIGRASKHDTTGVPVISGKQNVAAYIAAWGRTPREGKG